MNNKKVGKLILKIALVIGGIVLLGAVALLIVLPLIIGVGLMNGISDATQVGANTVMNNETWRKY